MVALQATGGFGQIDTDDFPYIGHFRQRERVAMPIATTA